LNKLTKRAALTLCRDMWREMSDHPKWDKEDYFYAHGIPFEDQPAEECYICEYVEQQGNDCGKCILKWRCGTCSPSEYGDWCNHRTRENALAVAKLAEDALAKMDRRKS